MNELASIVIGTLGYFTLFGQILIAVLLVLLFGKNNKSSLHKHYLFFKQNALTFIFIVSSSATLGSLFLSEIVSFVPCMLCWWQRIFMYPISIISLIALIRNDKNSVFYILPLSIIGAVIAAYHYIVQFFPNLLECSEEVARCSTIQFAELGYITIPVMSLTTFMLIAISSLFLIRK